MSEIELDCERAYGLLYDYLDGELDEAARAAVKAHLKNCSDCFTRFGFEKTYLLFLEAKTRTKGAPAEVRRRILDSLLKEEKDGS